MYRLFALATMVVTLSSACATPVPKAEIQPYFSAIIVEDIDASIDWYSKLFGLKTVNKTVNEERGFAQANLRGDSMLIELIEFETALSQKELWGKREGRARVQGYFKFGFEVSDFDGKVTGMKESDVTLYGDVVTDPVTGKKMVILLDPDGNRIQLFEK